MPKESPGHRRSTAIPLCKLTSITVEAFPTWGSSYPHIGTSGKVLEVRVHAR
jgi:hypothetical protein